MKIYLMLDDKLIIGYSYDFIEGSVETTIENPSDIKLCVDTFEKGKIVHNDTPRDIECRQRIFELKELLAKSDYIAIKYSDRAITEEEYEPIRMQRQSYRNEINQLETELLAL